MIKSTQRILPMIEILTWQLQLVEERQRERALGNKKNQQQQGAAADSHLYLGGGEFRGNACVAPALSEWISEELRKESSVLKENRQAREERRLLKDDKG